MDMNGVKSYFKEGLEIVKLDEKAMHKVAKDHHAFQYALLFFAIGGVAAAIGSLNIVGIVLMPVVALVGSFIGVGILHLLAKLFGGKAGFQEFYKVLGVGSILSWIAVIPLIGPMINMLVSIWYLVVGVKVLKAVHQLTTMKAVIVVAIPIIVGMVLMALLWAAIFAMIFAAGSAAGSMPDFNF